MLKMVSTGWIMTDIAPIRVPSHQHQSVHSQREPINREQGCHANKTTMEAVEWVDKRETLNKELIHLLAVTVPRQTQQENLKGASSLSCILNETTLQGHVLQN